MNAQQALTAFESGYLGLRELRSILYKNFPEENAIDLSYAFGWLKEKNISRQKFIDAINANLYLTPS